MKTITLLLLITLAGCVKFELRDPNIVTDIEGNEYPIVIIGSQSWLGTNLKTTTLNDGTSIPEVRNDNLWANAQSMGYCNILNNDSDNDLGRLYNGYVIRTHRLCPVGWRVARDDDWKVLEEYIGMQKNLLNMFTCRGNSECLKLMAVDGWGWGIKGTDDYGFTILATGYRYTNGHFEHTDDMAVFWTSTLSEGMLIDREFGMGSTCIYRGNCLNNLGLSVRCIKE